MACQAIGRCRLCARRHKIAVFGGEENQHFFIERANLKLIILNTVCTACIEKIEHFVKKMDLDMVFNDYIKQGYGGGGDNSIPKTTTKEEQKSQISKSPESLDSSTKMDVDHHLTRDQAGNKSEELNTSESRSNLTRNIIVAKNTAISATQARPRCTGDSQTAISSHPHHLPTKKIGQGNTKPETSCRKRPGSVAKGEEDGRDPKIKNRVPSSAASDHCSTTVKKAVRFLQCDFCKKEFTHSGDLNKHRRRHTGEKPYECDQCKRKFAHASNLARHQRVHSGERPFVCTKCTRSFTRRDKLVIHISADKCQINRCDSNNTKS